MPKANARITQGLLNTRTLYKTRSVSDTVHTKWTLKVKARGY